MGAFGYLLARKLVRVRSLPLHLFITGALLLHLLRDESSRYSLPQSEFIEEIKKLDGTADECYIPRPIRVCWPILRADFKFARIKPHTEWPIESSVTVIREPEGIETATFICANESEYEVDFIQMPGKHFFIFQETNAIMDIISQKLCVNINAVSYE